MPSITRSGSKWRVQIMVRGVRASSTFKTRQQAAAWALEREAELSGENLPAKTLGDAMDRYREEVSPGKRGGRWEAVRLRAMALLPIAARLLATLDGEALAGWRDARLAQVKPATVRREFNLLGPVLRACIEWKWLRENPLLGVKRPAGSKPRTRRISDDERDRICRALGYYGGAPANASQRVALAFLFALETAMRSGEVVKLTREHVHADHVHIPESKTGVARDVPLSPRAKEIIGLVSDSPRVFDLTDGSRDALFRKARDAAKIINLHFHDSRHEATTQLARKLQILDLARMTGHGDLDSLLIYYNPTPQEIAKRLA